MWALTIAEPFVIYKYSVQENWDVVDKFFL